MILVCVHMSAYVTADGDNMQFLTELFKYLLDKTLGVSLETFWRGILYCSVLYH